MSKRGAVCSDAACNTWARRVHDAQTTHMTTEQQQRLQLRVEASRQSEISYRRCSAVRSHASRSVVLATEGLRQMQGSIAPEDFSAVQERWQLAQQASESRQQQALCLLDSEYSVPPTCSARTGTKSSASALALVPLVEALGGVLEDEAEGLQEVAALVATTDASVMLANAAGVATGVLSSRAGESPEAPFQNGDRVHIVGLESEKGKQLNGQIGVVSEYTEETGRFNIEVGGGPRVKGRIVSIRSRNLIRVDEGSRDSIAHVLEQLKREPSQKAECAAKFALYEGYASQVQQIRDTLWKVFEESLPTLPDAVSAYMNKQMEKIDTRKAMSVPDDQGVWFVYHMMKQASENNKHMVSIFAELEQKLKFLAESEEGECPVCLESFSSEGPHASQTLSCCHKVCRGCWEHWCATMQGRPFCPLCRHFEFIDEVTRRAMS